MPTSHLACSEALEPHRHPRAVLEWCGKVLDCSLSPELPVLPSACRWGTGVNGCIQQCLLVPAKQLVPARPTPSSPPSPQQQLISTSSLSQWHQLDQKRTHLVCHPWHVVSIQLNGDVGSSASRHGFAADLPPCAGGGDIPQDAGSAASGGILRSGASRQYHAMGAAATDG